ncbi:sn-glycerol-3-phosphate transport system permease protein ugpA [uncultured Ruminococcus sp.]|nr:sugar ABC transporter permease [Clostridiales bacterium]SCH00401.1 sn-glycerol-3-phosphate transport system permease protein ugpA [uncultured Clostridium sp.]SCH96268.1 sn-glycerol-3-phosphate transport system permease protein ugpA [uncultured Ruminococcus sp.]
MVNAAKRSKRKDKQHQKGSLLRSMAKHRNYYIMLIPGLLAVTIFLYLPILGNFIAFKDYKIFMGPFESPWCGFDNFIRLFEADQFAQIFKNTLIIGLYKLIFGFPIPILLALLLNEVQCQPFKKTVQTVVYLPHFISWVVIASLATTLLSPNDGFLNSVIQSLGGDPIFFMGDSNYFRGVLVISDIWKEMGWSAIVYLAALSGIPTDMYEAATIDGASKFQKLIYITLPSLIPTIVIMLLLRVGSIVNVGFEQVFTMYSQPVYDVADIIDTYVYRVGIIDVQYGFATAAGLFKSVIACFMVVFCNWLAKRAGQESLF